MQEANWAGQLAAQWNDRRVWAGGIYWSLHLRLRNTNAYHQRSRNKRVSSASAKVYSFQMSTALAHSGGNPCSLLVPHRCAAARVMLAASPGCQTWTWTWVGKCQSTRGAPWSERGIWKQPAQAAQEETTEHDKGNLHKNDIKNLLQILHTEHWKTGNENHSFGIKSFCRQVEGDNVNNWRLN